MERVAKARKARRAKRSDTSPGRSAPATNPITVYGAWCKRCGICVAFCPKGVLEASADGTPAAARPEDCIRCHLCELRCPDFAISVANHEEETP